MEVVKTRDGFAQLKDNTLSGHAPELVNSVVSFTGKNNILYCEEGVRLVNSRISFDGSNSVVVLCRMRTNYTVNVALYNSSAVYFGSGGFFNGRDLINIACSERKHVIIGNGCLFSFNIWMRTADPHLIYSCDDNRRINPSKSVMIGDHVWLGQDAMLLKGTYIGSGSIIGARGVLSAKTVPSNCVFAGNPAKLVRKGVFWEGSSVHGWSEQDTANRQVYNRDDFKYVKGESSISFDELDELLTRAPDSAARLDVLKNIMSNTDKNRFAI